MHSIVRTIAQKVNNVFMFAFFDSMIKHHSHVESQYPAEQVAPPVRCWESEVVNQAAYCKQACSTSDEQNGLSNQRLTSL